MASQEAIHRVDRSISCGITKPRMASQISGIVAVLDFPAQVAAKVRDAER